MILKINFTKTSSELNTGGSHETDPFWSVTFCNQKKNFYTTPQYITILTILNCNQIISIKFKFKWTLTKFGFNRILVYLCFFCYGVLLKNYCISPHTRHLLSAYDPPCVPPSLVFYPSIYPLITLLVYLPRLCTSLVYIP
jgi:hypothetical protein